jgi:S-adenosyl methyltransferase
VLDTSTPNLARACDHLLGGGASFAADRALARRLEALYPGMRDLLFSSRMFAGDSVARVARSGVDQYLDLGSGLPTSPATHEIAQALCPGARVAYVDRDPAVVQHGRALVCAGVRCVAGDLAEPEAILASGDLAGFIDFSRPVCLVLTLILQVLDPGTARAVAGVLLRALPPGSYLIATAVPTAVSTAAGRTGSGPAGSGPGQPGAGAPGLPDFTWTGGFTAADLASFFAGLDLLPPGIQEGKVVCAAGVKPAAGRTRP